MPLQKQIAPIDFTGGLDKKADQKLVVPGKLTTLENGEFVSANTLRKRHGYTTLSTALTPSGNLEYPLMQAELDGELLQLTNKSGEAAPVLSGWSPGLSKWVERSLVPFHSVDARPSVHNATTQLNLDMAVYGGITVLVWNDASGGVSTSVFDDSDPDSSVVLLAPHQLSPNGLAPRVVVVSGKFCVFYAETTTLQMQVLDPASPTAWGAQLPLKLDVDVSTTSKLDACPGNAIAYVAYCRSSDGGANIFTVNNAGSIGTTAGTSNGATLGVHVNTFGANNPTTNTRVCLITNGNAPAINARTYTTALTVVLTTDITAAAAFGATDTFPRMTSLDIGGQLEVLLERLEVAGARRTIHEVSVATAGTVFVTGTALYGVALASAPFLVGGVGCVGVVNDSSIQPTFFVVAIDTLSNPRVIARALTWRAGGLPGGVRVPAIYQDYGNGLTVVPASERGRLAFSSGTNITPIGIARLFFQDMRDDSTLAGRFVELDDTLFIPSAAPSVYDGVGVTEHGFHLYPEGLTGTQSVGGSMANGTYQIRGCWEWIDGRGRLVRSVPSVAVTVVIAAGGGTASIIYSVPPLFLTAKTVPLPEVSVVFFRTEAGGSIFYRVSSATAPTLNNPTASAVTLTNGITDASLISNEILYTTGGVLERAPCPPCRVATAHQGRLFVSGLEHGDGIAYSGTLIDGEAAGFNEALVLVPQPDGGEVAGLASMDDKLMIGRELRWEYIAGQGPNALGQQNGYSEPQMASGEVGLALEAPRSLKNTDDGIWFRSDNGLRLLTRGLSIARLESGPFVGAEVDGLSTQTLAAVLDRRFNQLRFYDGTSVLAYDQQWRQWSKFTNHACVDAIEWDGAPSHVAENDSSQGAVSLSSSSLFTDNGTAIQFKLETGWLALAGVQGFQRVYELLLLGTFYGAATLTVEVAYDYSDTYQTAVSVSTGSVFTTGIPMQLRYKLPIQKCEACRFRIIEASGSLGFALSSFALLMGGKGGAFKLPAVKTVG